MLSAQHTSTEVQPAADHALLILYAEGGLGEPNFIHYPSQPSRSTKMFKRAENNNESEVLKVRFGQTTTVIDDRIILIGGSESVEGILPSNSLVLNSTSLNVNEQKVTLPVLGHGAVPIRGSKILITFGIQAIAPQRMFATPIQEIDVNTMNVIPSPQFIKGEVPQSRYDHTTTKIDDDKIFIYGGRNKDEVVLGDLFYLDLNSNSWNFINQPSHPIAGHSSILVNNYLISCFGIDANTKVINDCNIFDIFTNTFIQPIINEVPPIPRTLSSMVSFENNKGIIYIFGGIDENNNGLNDLYKLDVSKAPTLSWSPIIVNSKTTNNKLIPSGRGAHSAFTIEDTDIMTIWGGISNGNQLVDPNFYFFDIRGNAWVDKNFYIGKANPAQISLDGIKKPESSIIVVIFGIIGTIILIIGLLGFFIIRKRRLFQKFQKKEINNEPYSQSDQFGSNTYLISDFESKQAQFKIIDEPEPVPEPIPPPIQQIPQSSPTLSSPPTNVEKEPETSNNRQHNDSIISTTPKKMSFGKLPALSNTESTSETQRMKRSHKRTSSVSLTSSELASITRSRNFTHHKSSLSTNSISCSINRPNSHYNSRKSLSNFLDTVSEKGSNNRISSTSDRSVNSVQWVGFNSSMIYEQEENRDSLHVRNLPYKQQKNSTKYHENSYSSEDEEYTINGDYIDTSPRVNNNYNRNIFDHDEVIRAYDVSQRKNNPQNYSARNNIPRQGNIANENISRESGIIDHESPSSSYESSDTSNEDDKYSSMKKSKRSSKGISRVSFALKDEKIEFDENESSSTVSLTRRSLSSQSSTSSSSSATPSIIEEEIDILNH
ncbi:hypothetical protein RhiirA5_374257 [Rhizophagus irregularis]|uniref:Attractin/MKLN-like beta-propeller domain-containing protein n=1 Tax=Rhizophagus irregularis TaxID=588596 RepID=A0A2N0PVT6_9GLOM|nr:hypothetical protein RhiirA5_374257 [Rhizophagus irregularis]